MYPRPLFNILLDMPIQNVIIQICLQLLIVADNTMIVNCLYDINVHYIQPYWHTKINYRGHKMIFQTYLAFVFPLYIFNFRSHEIMPSPNYIYNYNILIKLSTKCTYSLYQLIQTNVSVLLIFIYCNINKVEVNLRHEHFLALLKLIFICFLEIRCIHKSTLFQSYLGTF